MNSILIHGPGSYEYRVPVAIVEKAKQAWTKILCRTFAIASERVSISFPKENWQIESSNEPFTIARLIPHRTAFIDGLPWQDGIWAFLSDRPGFSHGELLVKMGAERNRTLADYTLTVDDPSRLTYLGVAKMDRDRSYPIYRVNLIAV